MEIDVLIIGSGPSGITAARTLVERGLNVAVVDGGKQNKIYDKITPDKNFVDVRENDNEQHQYFLGNNFEGVSLGLNKVGAQLTPSRKYLIDGVSENLSIKSDSFFPMESLAVGGLGGGWGCGCYCFSEMELKKAHLNVSEMENAYRVISERIGISGNQDDGSAYSDRGLLKLQKPLRAENNIEQLLFAYNKNKSALNKKGIYAGRSVMAVLSEDFEDRKANSYNDMEFWSDHGKSAWRAWMEVERLKRFDNFKHISGLLVKTIIENETGVTLNAIEFTSNNKIQLFAKKIILAAGAIGTARIIMESEKQDIRLPILCNNYLYFPFLQWRRLGKGFEKNKSSLSQMVLYYDPNGKNEDVSLAALFSYRSLLLYKMIREVPLNFKYARSIFQYLHPAITLAGIHHPEEKGTEKYLEWKNGEMHARYIYNENEIANFNIRESQIVKAMKTMGCTPLKKVKTPAGSSIHYAGSLPFSNDAKKNSLQSNGKLNGYKNTFVADGSGFHFLPAKGITLSLMANAHNVATHLANEIR